MLVKGTWWPVFVGMGVLAACGGQSVRHGVDADGDGIVDGEPGSAPPPLVTTPTDPPDPRPSDPIDPPTPDPIDEPEPTAKPAEPLGPPPDPWLDPPAEDPQGYALIAGCAKACIGDCTFPGDVVISVDGVVVSPTSATQPGQSGTLCRNYVRSGARVTISAVPAQGRGFSEWGSCGKFPPLNWNDCPCNGSSTESCVFTASQRTYCGAIFTATP